MRKAISFLLTFCLLFSALSLGTFVSARRNASKSSVSAVGSITECKYDVENEKINISGNIDHDFLINHSKHQVALYSVPFGADYVMYIKSENVEPVAKTDISVKFDFSVKADTNLAKFSTYCVVAVDSEGDMIAIGTPKLPSVESSAFHTSGDKSSIKGVQTSLTSLAVSSGASSTIVPVYLNDLLSNASVGYLYSLHGSYIYFDREYINTLDARVKSLMATGSSVYLKFVLDPNEPASVSKLGESCVPDMSLQQNLDLVVAFTDFLCDRYNDQYAGTVRGIILGNEIDKGYAVSNAESVEAYAENYFRYLTVVSSTANQISPKISVVIPFSNTDSYSKNSASKDTVPSEILDTVCSLLDDMLLTPINYSVLIETDLIPESVANKVSNAEKPETTGEALISADNASSFSAYLDTLSVRYENVPSGYLFVWNVPSGLSYNVLSSAYAYSYFKLLPESSLISFVASFEDTEAEGNYDAFVLISDLVGRIDTSECFDVTKPQLRFLGANSWYQLIDDMYGNNFALRNELDFPVLDEVTSHVLGSFSYFDFSYQTDTAAWFGGSHCEKLNVDYSEVSGRTLKARFAGAFSSPSEYSELYCAYEYVENFAYTPFVALNFSLENDTHDQSAVYDVRVSIGSKDTRSSARIICAPYENVELLLDMSDFNHAAMAEYITFSVRCLSGTPSGYTLCLSSMEGYSDKHLSDELSVLIAEERLRLQNLVQDNVITEAKKINTVIIVAGVTMMVFVIGIGIFMCFKQDDEDEVEQN